MRAALAWLPWPVIVILCAALLMQLRRARINAERAYEDGWADRWVRLDEEARLRLAAGERLLARADGSPVWVIPRDPAKTLAELAVRDMSCAECGCEPFEGDADDPRSHERHCPLGPRARGIDWREQTREQLAFLADDDPGPSPQGQHPAPEPREPVQAGPGSSFPPIDRSPWLREQMAARAEARERFEAARAAEWERFEAELAKFAARVEEVIES